MPRTFILYLFLTLTSLACSRHDSSQEKNKQYLEGIDLDTTSDYLKEDLHPEAYSFDANIWFVNLTTPQEQKMNEAIEIIKLVIATDQFRQMVIGHTYAGEKKFIDNAGFTNEQIYQKILQAAETLQPARNNMMDGEVELYFAANNIVGYTYPNSNRIWVNTKFFDKYTAAGVAHNLFHEWLHKLGFNHATSWSVSRDHSVPYALGDLVGELGQDFL